MINLVKGNINNLKGKSVIYSKLRKNECPGCTKLAGDTEIIALYYTIDIMDFSKKFGVPEELLKEIAREQDKQFKEDLESMLKRFPELKDKISVSKIARAHISPYHNIKYEIEALNSEEDIVYSGEYSCIPNCIESAHLASKIYNIKFNEQLIKKANIIESKEKSSYADFNGKSIKNHMINTYIVPMLDSKNSNENDKTALLKSNFISFASGSSYAMDVIDLCMIVEKCDVRKKDVLDMIGYLADKAEALHTENYAEVAKLAPKIQEASKILSGK